MCNQEKDDWGGETDKPLALGYSVRTRCECSSLFFCFLKLRLLMEELVNFIERVPKAQSASLWKNKDIQR